jgi:ribosome-associated protein
MAILVTPKGLKIPEEAISVSFARSAGPGGQHVNTSSSKVIVRIDLALCGFPKTRLERLRARFGDEVRTTASAERSQLRNREAATARAFQLIDDSAFPPKKRVATKATRSSKERRLSDKAHASRRKADRRRPHDD